jgi:putative ABC transport system permease protein
VRIASPDVSATLSSLEKKWKTIDPVHGFKYQFFDDQLASTLRGFFDIVSILGYMAFIAIAITSPGTLGMAKYTTERRIKQAGIRKTLGADESDIMLLLSKEFIRVLMIAILIAAPLSYFLNGMWLDKSPNRILFGLSTILIGTLILLVPEIFLRYLRRNPGEVIKME